MADAPSGGGWTALEIIIVLILAIALLNRIQGKDFVIFPKYTEEPRAVTVRNTTPECGISVVRPKPLEKINDYVTVSGMVKPCGWDQESQIAVYAQIIDAAGVPVSEYVPVVASTIGPNGATFVATIHLNSMPARGTGYVLLIPGNDYPETLRNNVARIPVTFTR